MAKICFIGLGVMGYHMAGHLANNGHEVRVWNRTSSKSARWAAEFPGTAYPTIERAARGVEFVISCVGNDDDVKEIFDPALSAMQSGTIFIDHTTASATCARMCAETALAKGVHFLDAPISGGEAGAVNGQLTVMCGGDQGAFATSVPIIDAYAKAVKLLGPSGAGQLTKMVNQICIAGILQGLSEGVNFAKRAGLDVEEVIGAIGKGAAQSWQMDNRAVTMGRGEFEFGFAVDWMRKDLNIALEEAKENGADLTLTRTVDDYYADVQDMGGNRWDTSSLIKRLDGSWEE